MDILDKWLDDLPQQFQGKKYIEALISVFAKQLEDLYNCSLCVAASQRAL